MMASMSLPVGESSACSVIETTLMPRFLSMDQMQSTQESALLLDG